MVIAMGLFASFCMSTSSYDSGVTNQSLTPPSSFWEPNEVFVLSYRAWVRDYKEELGDPTANTLEPKYPIWMRFSMAS